MNEEQAKETRPTTAPSVGFFWRLARRDGFFLGKKAIHQNGIVHSDRLYPTGPESVAVRQSVSSRSNDKVLEESANLTVQERRHCGLTKSSLDALRRNHLSSGCFEAVRLSRNPAPMNQ
jgi:hypothetical protein